MDINQAKDSVISAGKKLLESGLIARTWGNVSCRLSDHQFVITPSGRPYETLTPNEIVSVNIIDCGFEGAIEPSSEKGVHAVIYGQRSDINFIIHTHQLYASAVSPLQTDIPVTSPTAAAMIGDRVICAPYALPGTKTITQTFAASLARSTGKAFLMAYHGAICFGKNYEETFQVAALLEKVCKDFIKHRYLRLSGQKEFDCDRMRAFYVSKSAGVKSLPCSGLRRPLYNSERSGEQIILYLNGTAAQPFPDGEQKLIRFDITVDNDLRPYNLPAEAAVHREIYRQNQSLNAVIHTTLPDIVAVSQTGRKVLPLLDDFAQIIGISAKTAVYDGSKNTPTTVARNLNGRYAIMLQDNGALCCGPTKSDAIAAVMVMAKNCRAVITTSFFEGVKPINPLESRLLRSVYLTTYAKRAFL